MNKITAIVEKTDTGYSAYLPDVPGVATAADTYSELRENVQGAINLYVETANEYKEEIPDILKSEYIIEFKFDIQPFMEWMSKVMSQRGLSEIANMNESLLSQYASGKKKPGPKQLKRIEHAIHRFASDLKAISF
ncbi:MAG: type II toxin-antitoxin system HicB family antitoxin [Prolixibacteraceae bacterium]